MESLAKNFDLWLNLRVGFFASPGEPRLQSRWQLRMSPLVNEVDVTSEIKPACATFRLGFAVHNCWPGIWRSVDRGSNCGVVTARWL